MKKSSFVFITMSVIYLAVAIFDGIGWMTVTNNVLLGLSLSALLSALSDILYNIGYIRTVANEFDYIIKTTVEFLSKMQAANIPSANPNINIKGVMQYVKGMSRNYEAAIPPIRYDKNWFITAMKVGSQILFVLSLAVFILLPFLSLPFENPVSTSLTLCAFSAMCFNLYLTEAISDIFNKRNDDFMNKEQLIIQTMYPDFNLFLWERMWTDEETISVEELQDKKPHADA